MATYKEIKGVTVQTRAEDPVQNVGTWASGGDLNTARLGPAGFGSTASAAYAAGGETTAKVAVVESYNGTSWTEVNDLNTARMYMTAKDGASTAALVAGGEIESGNAIVANNELWNGSSFSEGTDINTARRNGASSTSGTQTAVLGFAGTASPGNTGATEYWNGSSWTEQGDVNTGRYGLAGAGTYTSAIAYGGYTTTNVANAETFDGTSWTETSDLNTARRGLGGGGIQTAALAFGGDSGSASSATEEWNGSSWTEVNDLGSAQRFGGYNSSTSNTENLIFGGQGPVATTQEWSFPPPTAAILTEGSIFLSGGTTLKGFGKAAGIPAGTWGSGTNLPTANRSMGIFGPSTSTVVGGGAEPPPGSKQTNAYSWNGSSWTEIAELNATKNEGVGFGNSSTSGFINRGTNEEWDGSSWTERNDLNTARQLSAASGSSTAGLITGGEVNPSAVTETWDGTNWTEGWRHQRR